MNKIKTLFSNNLPPFLKVFSLSTLVTGCQFLSAGNDLISNTGEPIEITHDSAISLLANSPRNFFTDFSEPDQCLLSEQKPVNDQPSWVAPATVWQRIRVGMQLDHHAQNPRTLTQFKWYKNHPDYMKRVSHRAQRYIFYITEQLHKRQLPMELALLPIVESAYDPFAYSHGRASGMWQFIPGTARHFKLSQNWWYDARRDVIDSTDAALTYLTMLNKLYDGDWLLALAAYNSGQGTVNRAIRKNKKRGKATDFWSLDLPRETRSYVPKLLALARLVENPRRYGITLHPVPNQPYFAQVETHSQIDLARAADMAQVDIKELYRLNPGFNRWATAPGGPHRLLVPVSKKAAFVEQLQQYPPEQRLHWERYKVRNGDSLLLLARRFNTTAKLIRQTNAIRGNVIRAGQSLVIPRAARQSQHYALSAPQRLQSTQLAQTGNRASQQLFHTVKSGDSLWSIARRYQVKVAKLARWNAMAPGDILQPGQQLSIWTTPLIKTSTQAGSYRNGVVKKLGYKVRRGDSLARIAQRFNVRVKDIVKWNAVSRKHYLQPGQLLTLYVDVTNAIH